MAKRGPKYEPDSFESTFKAPLEWVAKHLGVFTIFIVTVFVVLLGMVFIFKASGARAERAWAVLATISGPDALIDFAEKHAGTPAEPVALHRAGAALLTRALTRPKDDPERPKDLEQAEKALRRLVDRYTGHQVEVHGRQALGQVYEELGRYGDAVREFKAALEIDSESYLQPKLEYDVGRALYLDGKHAEAEKYLARAAWTKEKYGRLPPYVDDYAWRENARYLLVMLKPGRREVDSLPKAAGDDEEGGGDTPEGDAREDDAPEGDGATEADEDAGTGEGDTDKTGE